MPMTTTRARQVTLTITAGSRCASSDPGHRLLLTLSRLSTLAVSRRGASSRRGRATLIGQPRAAGLLLLAGDRLKLDDVGIKDLPGHVQGVAGAGVRRSRTDGT